MYVGSFDFSYYVLCERESETCTCVRTAYREGNIFCAVRSSTCAARVSSPISYLHSWFQLPSLWARGPSSPQLGCLLPLVLVLTRLLQELSLVQLKVNLDALRLNFPRSSTHIPHGKPS